MSLSRADLESVSQAARLQLTADELDALTRQLGDLVQYVEQLAELDTRQIAPWMPAWDLGNLFADDRCAPGLDRAQALANAPKRDAECYRVPAVLGSGSAQ